MHTGQSSVDLAETEHDGEAEQPKANIWTMENFYAPDNESNIVMDGDLIKAATLPKLIAKMTSDGASMWFVHTN